MIGTNFHVKGGSSSACLPQPNAGTADAVVAAG